jgi:glutamate--cysteine ligase
MAQGSDRPIAHIDELVAYFAGGAKSADTCRVGVEHEKIAVLPGGAPPDYEVIRRLLESLGERGWRPVLEQGRLIALERPGSGSVTLEPGGQIEHSGAPWPSAVAAARDNDEHTDLILQLSEPLGLRYLGVGFRPFGTIDDVPWMPKGRYRVMREYLPKRGRLAHEMMKRTATVQANFDYVDEADAMDKLRVALGVSSLVTALFAASSLVDGRPSGYQSYRAACWLETDPDRCGLLPFAFGEGARFLDYVEWALDVPMFFVHRGGEYRPAEGRTFRRFLREGLGGERATLHDWELHLSTLFPEARLKRYVEVRQADAGPREMVRALPALWRGLLYDADARRATWSLVGDWTMDERQELYRETPRLGIRAKLRGAPLAGLCAELVETARRGLHRLGAVDGAALLEPLVEIAREGHTIADRMVEHHARAAGDPEKLIEGLRFR